jgi:hypothetical protein
MEPREVSAIFLRNEFPFEMDEAMTQYLAEILTDQSISREDQDELVTTLLISAYGEDIQPILTRILKDMNNKLKNNQRMSQKKKKEMMSQNSSQSLPVSIPLLQSPSQQAKKDLFPAKVGKSLVSKRDQSYFLPPKAPEVESPQLRSLRSILMENGVTTDSLDETITEYLIEVCTNEMISLEELQEIILTYFPSLDGDAAKAKRVVLSLISSTSSQDPPPSAVPLSLTPHSMEVEESDDDDGVESKSHGSDLEQRDEDWESEESELTLVNVDEVQEIFPVLPRLTLQYIHRVKCFDNFAETCQYLLDHQTGPLLLPLPSLLWWPDSQPLSLCAFICVQMKTLSSCPRWLFNITRSLCRGAVIPNERRTISKRRSLIATETRSSSETTAAEVGRRRKRARRRR